MRYPRFVFPLLLVSGLVVLSLVWWRSLDEKSVTPADLVDSGQAAPPLNPVTDAFFDRFMGQDSLHMGLIILSVLGICAVLLALRMIGSAVRLARRERRREAENRAGHDSRAVPPTEAGALAATGSAHVAGKGFFDLPETLQVDAFSEKGEASFANEFWTCLSFFPRGLSAKMFLAFVAVVATFGLLATAAVYFALGRSLTAHALQRAKVLAANVSDIAPSYFLKQDSAGLREFLRKLAKAPEVAYALAEDRNGNIFAHSFAVLPQEIESGGPAGEIAGVKARILSLAGAEVYEVAAPILEGRAGSARVAFWKETIDAAIDATVMPMMKWIATVILAGMALAGVLVWRIARPMIRLARTARQISQGDLDAPSLGVADVTEFGELSRAVERMRSSVKAALIRLDQQR